MSLTRFRRFFLCGLVMAMGVGLLPGVSQAGPLDFVGTWVNTNPASGGIVKLVISSDGVNSTIRAYGACTPTPCDWGTETLYFGGYTVSDAPGAWGVAVWITGFSITGIHFWPKGGTLLVESYTVFIDGSGRTPYYGIYLMER